MFVVRLAKALKNPELISFRFDNSAGAWLYSRQYII